MRYLPRLKTLLLAASTLILLLLSLGHQVCAQAPKDMVPNVFTPNGDGLNDLLELHATEPLTLFVYNRSGALVYKVTAKHIRWDGTNDRGFQIADGVYFYVLHDPAGTYKNPRGVLYISREDQLAPTEESKPKQ